MDYVRPYEIETERLLLRQWRDGDWRGLHRTYGDPEVMGWIGAAAGDLASTAAAVGRMSMHWRLLGYGMFAVEFFSPGLCQIAANADADFVLFDMEHGGVGIDLEYPSGLRTVENLELVW